MSRPSAAAAFPPAHREDAAKYLETLRLVMKDLADSQRRAALFALVLAAGFALIGLAAVEPKVSYGPFEVKDLGVVQKCLTTFFAYYVYDIFVLGIHFFVARDLYESLVKVTQPQLYATGFDRLLIPYPSSLYGPIALPGVSTPLQSFVCLIVRLQRVAALFAPLLCEAAAFTFLIHRYSFGRLILVNLIATVSLITLAGLFFMDRVGGYRSRRLPERPGSRGSAWT
jgi:hypothetical protein